MNIFGIGGWELILIGLIAVLILGPERMVRYAYRAGRWMRQFSVIWQESLDVLRENLGEFEEELPVEDIKRLRDFDIKSELGLKGLEPDEREKELFNPQAWIPNRKQITGAAETPPAQQSENGAEEQPVRAAKPVPPSSQSEEPPKKFSSWLPGDAPKKQ